MNPLQSYLASIKKPTYGGLLGGLSAPTGLTSAFGSLGAQPSAPTVPTPAVAPLKPSSVVPPSSPAATAPTPTAITSPVKTTGSTSGSPAQTGYVSSLTGQTSPSASPTGTPDGASSSNAPSYLDSYRDYLAQYTQSLKPSDEVAAARASLAKSNAELATQTLAARKQQEDDAIRQGGLLAGNQAVGARDSRENSYKLANAGLATTSAADALTALTGNQKDSTDALKAVLDATQPLKVGDTYIDPTTGKVISKDAYNLSAGQSRYEFDPVTGKEKIVASVPTAAQAGTTAIGTNGATYTPGVNPTVDSWANRIQNGTAKITDIPASQAGLRNQVSVALDAMGNSPTGAPTATELGKNALTSANSLLTKFDNGQGTSAVGKSGILNSLGYGLLPGTDRANFVTDFNTLKSQLSLDGVKYLKGQGQVSDAERALLAQATSKLSLQQSEPEFKTTLQGIIDTLSGKGAGILTSPDGTQEVNISDLTPDQIKEAQTAGWK